MMELWWCSTNDGASVIQHQFEFLGVLLLVWTSVDSAAVCLIGGRATSGALIIIAPTTAREWANLGELNYSYANGALPQERKGT